MEIKRISCDSFDMEYFSFGSGSRAFVIIPGVSIKSVMLSAQSVADAYSAFSDSHTVYVFDRIISMPDGYSVSDMADDTAKAMKLLGIADADIFGASQGGAIAQIIAVRYPELVHKAVLGSTTARICPDNKMLLDCWLRLADDGDASALSRDVVKHIYSEETAAQFADFFAASEKDITPDDIHRFRQLITAMDGFDILDELPLIKCPVLVIGSAKDRIFTGRASAEIAEKLGCELYIYEGFSHAVYDEAPDYKDRLAAFFAD